MALFSFGSGNYTTRILICIVLVQFHIASSALLLGLRNHHHNSHHRHPMLQANQTTCALFMGTWVHDDSYPIYQSSACSIIDPEFNCQMYGRPDSDYLKYRWKPANCELPRSVILSKLCVSVPCLDVSNSVTK